MKLITLVPESFSNPEVESGIEVLDHDLATFSKNHAQENHLDDLPRQHFQIGVVETVRLRTQKEIDKIKSLLQVPSLVVTTAEKEQMANDKRRRMATEITDKTVHLSGIQRQHDAIQPDKFKKRYGILLHPTASLCGLGDGMLAFLVFSLVYSPIMAVITAIAIGVAITLSHIFYTQWIMKATTLQTRVFRSLVILFTAFGFFAVLSNLRASAINQTAPVFSLNSNIISSIVTAQVSGWAVCMVSMTLFAVVFFLALTLWKSSKERQEDEQKSKLNAEIEKTKKEIEVLQSQMTSIESEVIAEKSLARMIHNYAVSCINRCRSIGENAINLFKNDYTRYHRTAPEYFIEQNELKLDVNLNYNRKNDDL